MGYMSFERVGRHTDTTSSRSTSKAFCDCCRCCVVYIQIDCRDVYARVPTVVVCEEECHNERRLKLWEGQTKIYSELPWRKPPDETNGRGR